MLPLTHISIDSANPSAAWQYTHALPIVTWPSTAYARASMTYALGTACCAVLCERLRLLAARMRAEVHCE
jgi:hypothetical protein